MKRSDNFCCGLALPSAINRLGDDLSPIHNSSSSSSRRWSFEWRDVLEYKNTGVNVPVWQGYNTGLHTLTQGFLQHDIATSKNYLKYGHLPKGFLFDLLWMTLS